VIYDIKVYINGVRYYQYDHFTCSYTNNALTIDFNFELFPAGPVDSGDEIVITGKFIEIV
jgi:hypothetical protein